MIKFIVRIHDKFEPTKFYEVGEVADLGEERNAAAIANGYAVAHTEPVKAEAKPAKTTKPAK